MFVCVSSIKARNPPCCPFVVFFSIHTSLHRRTVASSSHVREFHRLVRCAKVACSSRFAAQWYGTNGDVDCATAAFGDAHTHHTQLALIDAKLHHIRKEHTPLCPRKFAAIWNGIGSRTLVDSSLKPPWDQDLQRYCEAMTVDEAKVDTTRRTHVPMQRLHGNCTPTPIDRPSKRRRGPHDAIDGSSDLLRLWLEQVVDGPLGQHLHQLLELYSSIANGHYCPSQLPPSCTANH